MNKEPEPSPPNPPNTPGKTGGLRVFLWPTYAGFSIHYGDCYLDNSILISLGRIGVSFGKCETP